MDWDKEGEMLAFIQQGSPSITLWDKNTRKSIYLDTNFKEGFSWLQWSRAGPQVRNNKQIFVLILVDFSLLLVLLGEQFYCIIEKPKKRQQLPESTQKRLLLVLGIVK